MNTNTNTISLLEQRIASIRSKMVIAANQSGRDSSEVRLVAVSKTISADHIKSAIIAGIDTFGENYIQEAREKWTILASQNINWHFIGHLQRNKAKYVVRMFDLIHSVDSARLANEINKQAEKTGKVQNILLQVNLSGEKTKSGTSYDGVIDLVQHISTLPHLALKGLMTMPPFFDAPEKARPYFQQLRLLRDEIAGLKIKRVQMDELSMGMTGDFEVAIAEGATLVRIGTAIFGARR